MRPCPQKVHNVGTSKKPLTIKEMESLSFFDSQLSFERLLCANPGRCWRYDSEKINTHPCHRGDHIQVGGKHRNTTLRKSNI